MKAASRARRVILTWLGVSAPGGILAKAVSYGRAPLIGALIVCAAASVLNGHEGHGSIQPAEHELKIGDQLWRASAGVSPQDPVAGESIRIEVKAEALEPDGKTPGRSATKEEMRLRVDERDIELQSTNWPGVFSGVYRAEIAGEHRIVLDVKTSGLVARPEFPLQVRTGPASRLRPLVVGALSLISISLLVVAWQRRPRGDGRETRPAAGWILGMTVGAVALVAMGTMLLVPVLARQFLPEREPAAIDWESSAPGLVGELPAGSPTTTKMPSATASGGIDGIGMTVTARVVSAPGKIADVVVPMPGRIALIEGNPMTIGKHVTAGQKLATLLPTYNMHDALHLINQRWPILQSSIEARRRMLEAEAAVERLTLAPVRQAVSLKEVQAVESEAALAKQESERWSRTLAMHDQQIKDDEPVRTDIRAPIDGDIAAATFTQGQIVYEGSPLFTIVDLTTVWVEVKVPEQLASGFRAQDVNLVAAAFPNLRWKATFRRAGAEIDPETRTLSRFYSVANPHQLLRLGMLMTVSPLERSAAGS